MPRSSHQRRNSTHLRGAGAVAVGGGLERALARPAPVAVDDHRDVMRAAARRRVRGAAGPDTGRRGSPGRRRLLPLAHTPTLADSRPPEPVGLTASTPPARPRIGAMTSAAGAPTHPTTRTARPTNGGRPAQHPAARGRARARQPPTTKPTWRGWIHAGTFPLAIAAGVVLIALAEGAPAKWSAAVFMATLAAAVRHLGASTTASTGAPRSRRSSAGSTTPTSSCSSPAPTRRSRSARCRPTKAVILLSLVWGGALLGIGFRVFWIKAPRWLYVPLYMLLGWAAMMYIVDLVNANVAMMVLVHRGRPARTRSARSSTGSSGRTRSPGCSASTRSSTRHGARVPVPLDRDPADRAWTRSYRRG